jgi:hypothetical protein
MMYFGNTTSVRHVTTDLVIGACGANAVTEVAVTIPGVAVGDMAFAACRQTLTAGISLAPCRVSAANTVQICLQNLTAAPIDPADTFDFDIMIFKATGNAS